MTRARYGVVLSPAALRALGKLDRGAQRRLQAVIELLADDPHPPASRAVVGQPAGTFRVRTGDYRVVYEVHDDRLLILVIRIGHRREVYRRM
jgi:mRNA interferase RelE/StbE